MAERDNEFLQTEGAGTRVVEDDGLPVGMIAKLLIAGLIIAAVVIFVLQNLDNVPVNFLSWSFDAPLILLLAVAAGAGILLRWIVSFARSRRKSG